MKLKAKDLKGQGSYSDQAFEARIINRDTEGYNTLTICISRITSSQLCYLSNESNGFKIKSTLDNNICISWN